MLHHRYWLEQQIEAAAGLEAKAQWFERQDDGRGLGLASPILPESFQQRTIRSDDFPPLLIQTKATDPILAKVINEYIQWRSIWLLCLPNLPDEHRETLEVAAQAFPMEVQALHKIYPKIIQQELMNKILVQAKLMQANAQS